MKWNINSFLCAYVRFLILSLCWNKCYICPYIYICNIQWCARTCLLRDRILYIARRWVQIHVAMHIICTQKPPKINSWITFFFFFKCAAVLFTQMLYQTCITLLLIATSRQKRQWHAGRTNIRKEYTNKTKDLDEKPAAENIEKKKNFEFLNSKCADYVAQRI